MPIETSVTHIADLEPLYPLGTDNRLQGDNHIRNIKTALKNDLPLTTPATATGIALLTTASPAAARTALSAASAGANSDITSITGLTTALSIAQGGTAATTAAAARTSLDVYSKAEVYTKAETDTKLDNPAFSAYVAADQTVTSGVITKANFDTEEFDIGSCYDTTNKRWTPNKAGYYYIGASINNTSSAGSTDIYIFLYKNNANYRRLAESRSPTPILGGIAGGTLVYMNGTTDYVEIFPTLIAGGSCSIRGGATFSCFYGYFVRS